MKAICSTCTYWNQGAPGLATGTRSMIEDPSVGTCERYPPSIVEGRWFHDTYFPRTHMSRTCGDWTPDYDPADPDGGERAPQEPGEKAAVVLRFERAGA